MLKLTRTGLGLLTRQYRSVLKKCWLINVGLWHTMGADGSSGISFVRLFTNSLLFSTALSTSLLFVTSANAGFTDTGSLCYTSEGAVVFHNGADCDTSAGETRLAIIGPSASSAVPGNRSTALGNNAQATGWGSTALGYNAKATGSSSTALGADAQATGSSSTALGVEAKATSWGSTALGYYAKATGDSSIALGYNAQASGDYSTALGYEARADSFSSMALGYYARAYGNYSSSFGYYARVGTSSSSIANSISLGYQSVTEQENTISVGHLSTDKSNAAGTGSTTYGSDLFRRIINVADGTGAHDVTTYGQVQGWIGKNFTDDGFTFKIGDDTKGKSDLNILSGYDVYSPTAYGVTGALAMLDYNLSNNYYTKYKLLRVFL